jgi:hypothetical protein
MAKPYYPYQGNVSADISSMQGLGISTDPPAWVGTPIAGVKTPISTIGKVREACTARLGELSELIAEQHRLLELHASILRQHEEECRHLYRIVSAIDNMPTAESADDDTYQHFLGPTTSSSYEYRGGGGGSIS